MNKKILILIIIVLIAALGGTAAVFLFKDTKSEDQSPQLYQYAIKDPFVTNVKQSSKLFKATIVLEVNKEGMDEFFKENEYTMRDTILFMLRDLSEQDIKNSDIQEKLRAAIPKTLNSKLKIDNIVSIYFSDFVMQ